MVVSIKYSTIKKRSRPYWISRNTGNFFCFNSSLSNLYNNVIIYTTKKVVRTGLFVNEFTEFSYSCYKALEIDMFLYPTLTIQASSRLKRSANHLWNNSDVCRKKFGEWSPLSYQSTTRLKYIDKFDQLLITPQWTSTVDNTVRSLIHLTIFYLILCSKTFPIIYKIIIK